MDITFPVLDAFNAKIHSTKSGIEFYYKDDIDEYVEKISVYLSRIGAVEKSVKEFVAAVSGFKTETTHCKHEQPDFADVIFECTDGTLYFNKHTLNQYERFRTLIAMNKSNEPVKCDFEKGVMIYMLRHMDGQFLNTHKFDTQLLIKIWRASDYYQLSGLMAAVTLTLESRTLTEDVITLEFAQLFHQLWDVLDVSNMKAQFRNIYIHDLTNYPIEHVIRHGNSRDVLLTWVQCNIKMPDEALIKNIDAVSVARSDLKEFCEFIKTVYRRGQ